MVSMCTLKHAQGHGPHHSPNAQEAEETPEQNPEDVLCSTMLILRQGMSGSVQIQTVWTPALSECEIHTTYFLCVHDTVLLRVLTWMCPTLLPFTLCTEWCSVFVTGISLETHTPQVSHVSFVFTYLPYIIYLVLIPAPVIELCFSPIPFPLLSLYTYALPAPNVCSSPLISVHCKQKILLISSFFIHSIFTWWLLIIFVVITDYSS